MPVLSVVAHVHADPAKADLVRSELEKLVAPTRAEPGCLQYDLHTHNDDPAHFVFYERWESRDHWLAHMDTPHVDAYRAAIDGGAVESFSLDELTRVEVPAA